LIGFQLRSRDIEVELDLDTSLPEVFGDPDQLSQVIVNLLLNAMHAMEQAEEPLVLTIRTRSDRADGGVEMQVADTGPGVPQDIRGRIFDPIFTTKPVGLGTGIGLAVCHAMVVAHGGTITVGETPAGGAEFTVLIPRGGGRDALPVPGAPGDVAGGASRVLVVDDDREIRELLGDILESTGLRIDVAADGEDALQLIAAHSYAAILCDLGVPGKDGPELYREVARRAPQSLSRFIFTTGDLMTETAESFLTETARPCLAKPFLPEQVRHIVCEVAAQEKGVHSWP
jgi:two-component system NtrC family sensor kinase